ncbi:LysR family transcriptional regulator [Comamonas serinivorans]|uniref:LysR family transcriptional regulator n=1 Tax=Comamonas serinivorans TaxID=1082851 RepID=A0A1Y0ELD0_9BURK|nr:LysR family transcriptional regulator [Comamonas serinivorans]ARU04230.1 LysR family transcriptional regulator [Comamonas serinivorans]
MARTASSSPAAADALPQVELAGLTLLVDILDAGNLSQAAQRLKTSRANVSYHLNQLEKAAGVQLVRRTTRRVEPTEIGQRLYEHAQVIRNEMLAARETIATLGQGLQGRVGLAVPSGYGQMVMSDWLIAFKRAYPAIVLDVLFENRVDDLIRDDVDVAVRILHEPPPNVVARDMGRVRYLVCATRRWIAQHGAPTTPQALRSVPLITASVPGRHVRLRAWQGERGKAEQHEVMLEASLISEHFPFLRQAILADLGVGLVPDYVVASEMASGEVVHLLADWQLSIFGQRIALCWLPGRHQTRAVRTCIDFLLAHREA